MRPLRVLALGVPAILLPLFACEDSSSSSSGGVFTPDSGSFEAGPTPEAGPIPDAATDTTPPAPRGVTVTVVKLGAAQADIRVLSHDATGAVTGDVKTDAAGKVTLSSAPSMITVLSPVAGAGPNALTYLGVADGDTLNVELPGFPPELPPLGNYSITSATFGGADLYEFNAGGDNGCFVTTADPTVATNLAIYAECKGAQNAVLATASAAGTPTAFGFAKGLAAPAGGATINVGPLSMTARGTATVTATALPAVFSGTYGMLRSVANGFAFHTGDGTGALDDGGLSFPIATGFAEAYQAFVHAWRSSVNAGGPEVKGFLRRAAAPAGATASMAFDFATTLPYLTNGTVTGAVPARPDVTITADGALGAVDGGFLRVRWPLIGGAPPGTWTFVLPPGTTTFKVPALPNDAAQYLPKAGAVVQDIVFVEASQLPGYAQLKALPLPADAIPAFATDANRVLAVDGTVKFTSRGIYLPGTD